MDSRVRGMVAFAHRSELTYELFLGISRLHGEPVRNAMGGIISPEVLKQDFARQLKRGSARRAFLVPPIPRGATRAPAWTIELTGIMSMQVGEEETDAFVEFDVLKNAEQPFAVFGSFDAHVDLARPTDGALFLATCQKVPLALDTDYAFGGDVYDFVDPELKRPLDKPWPVLYFDATRAARLDLANVPGTSRVERQPDGGVWILTGDNPFLDFPRKPAALDALGKALGFPLPS